MLQFPIQRVRKLNALGNDNRFSTTAESSSNPNPPRIPNLIGGTLVDSQSSAFIDVINPMFPVAVPCGNTFVLKPSEKRSRGFYNPCRVSNGGWIA